MRRYAVLTDTDVYQIIILHVVFCPTQMHAEIALIQAQTAYVKACAELQGALRGADPSASVSQGGTGYFEPRTPSPCHDSTMTDLPSPSLQLEKPSMQSEAGTGVFLPQIDETPSKAGSTASSEDDAVWLNLEDVAYSST